MDKTFQTIRDLQLRVDQLESSVRPETLKSGDGGGTSSGMEARIAKLEAQMEHVGAELRKLTPLPVDVAAMRERLDHLPTKVEVRTVVDNGLDRVGTRVQRAVTIGGIVITALLTIVGLALKFWTP